MDLDVIKRGLRAEIKKRENEQYFTFQCNVRQMCKDVLAKLEEQESVIAEKDAEILRMIKNWNRLCEKYNKFIKLKQEFCDKFKDIELEITK